MMVFAQATSVCGQTVCCPIHICSVFKMSRYAREYGQASSWYNRGWAPPAKQHTKNSHSGWSKRAARGYQSDHDDRTRQWEDSKPSGSTKDNEEVTEVTTVAEVKVAENRDKYHGRVATDNAASTAPALSGTLRRQWRRRRKLYGRGWGELHRLLNDRMGSLSTFKKNAEANDRA